MTLRAGHATKLIQWLTLALLLLTVIGSERSRVTVYHVSQKCPLGSSLNWFRNFWHNLSASKRMHNFLTSP